MDIYYVIKQCSKHEYIWWQNVLLKQKVVFISHKIFVKRDKRLTDRQWYVTFGRRLVARGTTLSVTQNFWYINRLDISTL